jgi:predicted nucleic acid-binding protein
VQARRPRPRRGGRLSASASGGAPAGLGPGSVLLVDSSALVYLVEGANGSPRRAAVSRFLEAAARGEIGLVVSALAWAELLEGPLRSGDAALAARCRALLADSPRVRVEPVDVAIAEESALLRARRGLGLADCIHIATARVLGADAVLTNDEAWRRVPECPPVLLVDELAFDEAGPDG